MKARMTSAARTALRAASLARGTAWILTLTALLATGATMAPAAQATAGKFTAASYPVTVTGDQDGGTTKFSFGKEVRGFTCREVHYEATLSAPSEAMILTPGYGECSFAPGGGAVDINDNGCKYELTVPNVAEHKMTTAITSCSSPLEINITGICKITMANQKITTGIEWVNKAEDITFGFSFTPATTVVEGPKTFCSGMTISGSSTLTGYRDEAGREGPIDASMIG